MQSSSLSSVTPRLISLGTYTARTRELSGFEALFGRQTANFELVSGRIDADGATASGLYVVCFIGGFSDKFLGDCACALSEGRLLSREVLGLEAAVVAGISSLAGWLRADRAERGALATADEMPAVFVVVAGKVGVFRLDVL